MGLVLKMLWAPPMSPSCSQEPCFCCRYPDKDFTGNDTFKRDWHRCEKLVPQNQGGEWGRCLDQLSGPSPLSRYSPCKDFKPRSASLRRALYNSPSCDIKESGSYEE